MDLKFVEAGHGNGTGNWGKFAIGRYIPPELAEPTQFPGCEGQRVVSTRGNGFDHVWVFDLATGEAARFTPGGLAQADLENHQIWVCPLFEPFLEWLYEHVRANRDETHSLRWWYTLPRTVELPDAPFEMAGYRRSGAQIRSGWVYDAKADTYTDGQWRLEYHSDSPPEWRHGSGWYLFGPDITALYLGPDATSAKARAGVQILAYEMVQKAKTGG